MTRTLVAALGVAAFALSAIALVAMLMSGAWLADLSARSKPSVVSCAGPVPHVEAAP